MFKEEGYEEFLAEKIRRGEEDVKAGRVVTLEESKAEIRLLIESKARELEVRIQTIIHSRRLYPRP